MVELRSCSPADHILSNLEITSGILCTSDVVVIFLGFVVAIKDYNCFLAAVSQTLRDALPGLLLPLHHVEKPSPINHQGAAGLIIEVK